MSENKLTEMINELNARRRTTSVVILLLSVLLFVACNIEPREHYSITSNSVGSELKWGMDFTTTRQILNKELKLEYTKELTEGEENKIIKAYEFLGGSIGGIETEKWITVFKNDSLLVMNLYITKVNPKEIEKTLTQLTKEFIPDDAKSPHGKRWLLQKEGKRISEIQVLVYPDKTGIHLTFARPFANIW